MNNGNTFLLLSLLFQIIALDARNHGESPHSDDMDYHHMSEDVFRVMDDEGIDKACLMGHSMGGKTCMTAALTEVGYRQGVPDGSQHGGQNLHDCCSDRGRYRQGLPDGPQHGGQNLHDCCSDRGRV